MKMTMVSGLAPLLLAALWIGIDGSVPAADLEGIVTDYITSQPIDGATVRLTPKGKTKADSREVGTHDGGNYLQKDMTKGDLIEFEATDFKSTSRVAMTSPMNVPLMPQYKVGNFPATEVAKAYLKYAKGPDGKPQDFSREWAVLRHYQIAPDERIALAQAVVSQYESALTKFPDFKQYTEVNKEAVATLSVEFRAAINSGGEKMPGGSANKLVGDHVIADIVTYELRVSKANQKEKKAFLERFSSTWRHSPAPRIVMDAYGFELMRVIDPR